MITLTKIFSREKTLFYFSMWNDSDRLGYKRFLGYEVKNNAFIILPPGKKGSVWYDQLELDEIDKLLKEKISSDSTLVTRLQDTLDNHWNTLLPYLAQEKEVKNGEELKKYYSDLVEWWSAMNTAFTIPDIQEVDQKIKDYFLARRTESEKYTEQMNKVFIRAWKQLIPELQELAHFVSPGETIEILTKPDFKELLVSKVQMRTHGCGMFNEIIYPTLDELHTALSIANVSLHDKAVVNITEVKGTIAFKGLVQGKVRIINGFVDMPSFVPGEILITEMTNPDYLPIMRQSIAVVTDEGGMTCHAAIASRELKIPCVVGTKLATKAFKTGDVVEVNANEGIIKLIS